MKSRALSPVIDRWEKVRTSLEEAAHKVKKTTPGFDLSSIPLTDKKVLALMLSLVEKGSSSWAPFSNPQARAIFRLAKVIAPRFEDFLHLKTIWTGKAYGSGLTNEYIARRSGEKTVGVFAWTKTINGGCALELSSKPITYMGKKNFQTKIYPCPEELKPELTETFGLILFRDQLETICSRIAGFNKEQAASMYCPPGSGYDDRYALLQTNGAKFLKNATGKGYSEARVDEILWYIGYERYSQPTSRPEAHEYVKYAYLHAYLNLHYPSA